MNDLSLFDTKELQSIDNDFHLHPFTDTKHLHTVGSRIITDADGVYIWDSEGNKIMLRT